MGGRDIDIPAKKSTLTATRRGDLAPLRPRWRLSLAVQCLDANVAKNKSGTSTLPEVPDRLGGPSRTRTADPLMKVGPLPIAQNPPQLHS